LIECLFDKLRSEGLPTVDFPHADLAGCRQCLEQHVGGRQHGCVLIRRLNSLCSRSIAFVVRALRHWLGGSRVKVKNRSPAPSRLSATALHFTRHLQMKARQRLSIAAGEAA
jgi:hypothetical protein